MRKKIRLLIALFTLGQAAMAQSLNSGEQHQTEGILSKDAAKDGACQSRCRCNPILGRCQKLL